MIETLVSADKVFKHLCLSNDEMYNYRKLAEELFELGEIVMKKINKNGGDKEPSINKFIEEMADVELRIEILKETLNIFDEVERYKREKLTGKFAKYINEGKYIGRI